MKDSFRFKSVVVLTIVLNAIMLVFSLVSVILEQGFVIDLPYDIPYVLMFITFLALLIAFVSGDIRATRYRKAKKLWSGSLPLDVKQRVWNIRTPWLMLAILSAFVNIVYSLIWRVVI
ncbi:MAG: hypothetical protein MR766_02540 [Erysipelotrichaceae bacterium]|nr:hypothetical protein [Erysipelotrichaceae bacterium]